MTATEPEIAGLDLLHKTKFSKVSLHIIVLPLPSDVLRTSTLCDIGYFNIYWPGSSRQVQYLQFFSAILCEIHTTWSHSKSVRYLVTCYFGNAFIFNLIYLVMNLP